MAWMAQAREGRERVSGRGSVRDSILPTSKWSRQGLRASDPNVAASPPVVPSISSRRHD